MFLISYFLCLFFSVFQTSSSLNDEINVVDYYNTENITTEVSSKLQNFHIVCTEKFSLTVTKRIEIIMKNDKKLYEIELYAMSIYRQNSKN